MVSALAPSNRKQDMRYCGPEFEPQGDMDEFGFPKEINMEDASNKISVEPLLPLIDTSINLLLLKDGDRDHMNHSAINCEQSMAIVEVLRRCREYFA